MPPLIEGEYAFYRGSGVMECGSEPRRPVSREGK